MPLPPAAPVVASTLLSPQLSGPDQPLADPMEPLNDITRDSHPSSRPVSLAAPHDSLPRPPSRSPSQSSRGEPDEDYKAQSAEEDAMGEADDDDVLVDDGSASPASAHLSITSSSSEKRKREDDDEDDGVFGPSQSHWVRRSARARALPRAQMDDDSDSDVVTTSAAKRRKIRAPLVSEKASPAATPLSDVESDDYESKRQKQRRRMQNKAALAFPYSEQRNPSRRAAQNMSYNEADDEEYDEDEVASWKFTDTAEGPSGPAVGAILDYRRIGGMENRPYYKLEDDDSEITPGRDEFEYLVKYQDKAHYAAEWMTYAQIMSMEGSKRLQHFYLKIVTPDWLYMNDAAISAEDKEGKAMARMESLEQLNEHHKIERVVDQRTLDDVEEYYVKWKGLPYDYCTWEEASFVGSKAQPQIDSYLDRIQQLPVSNKLESNPVTRRKMIWNTRLTQQPDFVKGGQLRDFQLVGLNFLAMNWSNNTNVILADEMGLGKTVQTICFLNWLRHERQQNGPFLVVVPLSTMPAWADTFDLWAPDVNYVVYQGAAKAREIIREKELFLNGDPRRPKFHVLLTTYEFVGKDKPLLAPAKWQFMAVDEAHRLKNPKSALYGQLLEFGSTNRLLITGTPIQNNLSELRALMEFLSPGRDIVKDDIDYEAGDASERLAELNENIKPYILRRTKQQVLDDLPPKTEKIIRLELSDLQLDYYKNILTRNYSALSAASKGERFNLTNIMIELKKASNHPFLFPGAEEHLVGPTPSPEEELRGLVASSGKMMLLDQLLPKLKRDGHRVLIFSQFVGMLDILGDYLSRRGHQFQRLDGNIATGQRNIAIQHFNDPESEDFAFLLSTRAGGLGINLATADTVIIFDSDWNPQADLQAMARAHRIGQKKPVTVFRLVSKDTVEEEILERARNKLMLEYITIQRNLDPKKFNLEVERKGISTEAPSSSEDISRLLKRRGQKMFEQTGNQKRLEQLDIDAVLENAEEHETKQAEGLGADGGADFLKNFEVTDIKLDEQQWEDIIPKEEIERVQKQAEEERRRDAEKKAAKEAANSKKRRADPEDTRDQRAAKKRARELESEKRSRDPKRPLSKEEIKALVEAQLRWGHFDDRPDEIVKEAGLEDRDRDVLKTCLNEIHQMAEDKLREEQDRHADIVKSGGTVNKKEQKSILFDYHGAFSGKPLNADTIISRAKGLHLLREAVQSASNYKNFRIPEATNPAKWTASWGAKEDGMLCVGVVRYGYNGWAKMEEDEDLQLQGHMYLNEHHVAEVEKRKGADGKIGPPRTPGSVHLGRRVEYLCIVLRAKHSKGTDAEAERLLENYHRSNKRPPTGLGARQDSNGRASNSPAPNLVRKGRVEKTRANGHDQRRHQRVSSSGDVRVAKHRLSTGERSQSPNVVGSNHLNGYSSLTKHKRQRDGSRSRDSERPVSRKSNEHKSNGHAQSKSPSTAVEATKSEDAQMRELLHKVVNEFKTVDPQYRKGDRQERVSKVRSYVRTTAEVIEAKCETRGSEFELACWNYVASHCWFHKNIAGEAIKSMAVKVKEQDKQSKAKAAAEKESSQEQQQQASKAEQAV